MNKIMFIVAAAALGILGYFYLLERDEVALARIAVTTAAESTAAKLAQKSEPGPNTDADAESIFKNELSNKSAVDELAVKQSVEPLAPGRFRQSVKVFARARTSMSEFFNLQGAEMEVVATREFERGSK